MKKTILKAIVSGLFRVLHFLLALLMIALVGISIFRPDLIEAFIEWMGRIIHMIGNWNYLVALCSSMIEAFPVLGMLVPGQQIMLLVGGFFGKHNLLPIIAVAIVGAVIGNYIGYLLGQRWGDVFFSRYGDWFGIGKTELRILKKQIEKNGAWFILLGKFHNLTRTFVPFIAGSMGMKARKFWIFNILGSILWAVTMIVLGVAFVEYYKILLQYITHILLVLLAGGALYIAFFRREQFREYLREKELEIEEKMKG